eukprot:scaffold11805_cov65-Phaeocystis_antarctica.AAC.4
MSASLQHGTSHARWASADRTGASGGGRGFEGRTLTRQERAACSPACNTGTHAWLQLIEPGPAGKGAGLRAIASRGFKVLHVRPPAKRGIARARVVSQ